MLQNNIWDKLFQREYGKYPAEHLIRFVAANFYKRKRESVRILEVGCGPGANVWYLSREGFDAYGIDGSSTAIEQAKQRLCEEGLQGTFCKGDINNLPYDSNFFDAVIDNECIYSNTIPDTNLILQNIHRVLKPDGLFFSRTFSGDMYVGNDAQQIGYLEFKEATDGPIAHTGYFRLMDKQGIENLYGKYFHIQSIDKMDYTRNNGTTMISEWIIICRKL